MHLVADQTMAIASLDITAHHRKKKIAEFASYFTIAAKPERES